MDRKRKTNYSLNSAPTYMPLYLGDNSTRNKSIKLQSAGLSSFHLPSSSIPTGLPSKSVSSQQIPPRTMSHSNQSPTHPIQLHLVRRHLWYSVKGKFCDCLCRFLLLSSHPTDCNKCTLEHCESQPCSNVVHHL